MFAGFSLVVLKVIMVCLHPAAVQVSAIFSPLLEYSSGKADIGVCFR